MLQGEHSAILLTFIKLPFVIKIFVLPIFEWPFYTDFIVIENEFSYLSTKIYVVGTQKNHLDEHPKHMFKLMGKKITT